MSLEAFVGALPKAELHVHLEGAMRPATLLALARRNRVSLPADDVAGLREWFRFRDFDQFVEVYLACSDALKRPEDFQLLLHDFAADQERENVRYSEIHFTVGTVITSYSIHYTKLYECANSGTVAHGRAAILIS